MATHGHARGRGHARALFPWRGPGEGARAGGWSPLRRTGGAAFDGRRARCAATAKPGVRSARGLLLCPSPTRFSARQEPKAIRGGRHKPRLCLGRLRNPAQRGRFDNSNYRICAVGRPPRMAGMGCATPSGDERRWALSAGAAQRLPLLSNGNASHFWHGWNPVEMGLSGLPCCTSWRISIPERHECAMPRHSNGGLLPAVCNSQTPCPTCHH